MAVSDVSAEWVGLFERGAVYCENNARACGCFILSRSGEKKKGGGLLLRPVARSRRQFIYTKGWLKRVARHPGRSELSTTMMYLSGRVQL